MKPIIKFNGGRGAILCNKCRVILKEDLTKEEVHGKTNLLLCDKCKMMKNLSRKISYLLRHNPEDLVMDNQGWVNTKSLLDKLHIDMEDLEEIVVTNNKKRFGFNEDKSKIRAHQGHSEKLKLDIKFNEVQFPVTYYHGTILGRISSIMKNGLIPQSRAYVHLSKDIETAIKVGKRHGKHVIILSIDGNQMKKDGLKLYESENGVILAKMVPIKYIKREST